MSLDDKSKEPSTALESTRCCSNRCNCTTLDGDSGAGANAGSRVDMTFVGAGPLSELVWCPQKGLSLKCADGSFCQEKPCILWCPEASDRATPKISEGDRTEIPVNFVNSSTGVVHPNISSHEREAADVHRSRVGNNCGSVKQIIAAGEDDEQNLTKRREGDDFPAKLEAGTSKKVHEVAHSSAEVKIISPPGNEFVAEGEMPLGTDTPSSSRIRRYRMKGKGRDLSDGIPDGKISHEGENSHESVESCNSAGLYSAGKKQLHYDSSLIVGSKRFKRNIQESPGSSSLVRHDSSFMNWIYNMMNGLVSSTESTVPSIALTLVDPDQCINVPKQRLIGLDKKTGSAGFQTFFDSLYRPKRKVQEILPLNSADRAEEYGAVELDAETGSFYKLFKLPDTKSNECALQNGIGQLSRAMDSSSKNLSGAHHDNGITASMGYKGSINLATEEGEGGLGKKINFELPFDGEPNQAYCSEGDPVTSLWIARFTPTVPAPLSKQDACNQTLGEAPTCLANGMTLKNIVPSDATQDALPAQIHPAELGASSISPSKSKCKERDGYGRRLSDGGDCHIQAANALSTCDGNDTRKRKDLNTRQDEEVSSQHEKPKLFDEGISSCFMRRKSSDDPKSIFDAVKRLQLSRSDVVKCIHSHMPLSCLDGYFVRLRLGKWDAGLGKPQYHVACITGVQKERVLQNPKFSISVDVGGISRIVESQNISNQDFIEDELMVWWTSNSKGGGQVPSEENLRLKFQ